ncbi:MAG: alkane 1-monooxygenase [Saprospiraceae bacterium]
MKPRDIKYLLAYIIPMVTWYSLLSLGYKSYSTIILAFIIIPFIELFTPKWTDNYSEGEKAKRNAFIYFDILLALNIFWIYGLLFLFFKSLQLETISWVEMLGLTLSMGIVLGSNAINVAHELGHKKGIIPRLLAIVLLWPTLYNHFTTEHNLGHHSRVGTLEDPATSRYGEWLYFFWFRSIIMGFRSSWHFKLKQWKSQTSMIGWMHHPILSFIIFPVLYPVIVFLLFDFHIMALAMAAGILSIFLLETINYIEHYGLLRNKLPNGRYQNVESFHSWNSNHEIGRIVLYELTRHSDHHYKAYKKYQNLDHHNSSPQLPFGYPTSILLALFPPIWFSIMNPLVKDWRQKNIKQNENCH